MNQPPFTASSTNNYKVGKPYIITQFTEIDPNGEKMYQEKNYQDPPRQEVARQEQPRQGTPRHGSISVTARPVQNPTITYPASHYFDTFVHQEDLSHCIELCVVKDQTFYYDTRLGTKIEEYLLHPSYKKCTKSVAIPVDSVTKIVRAGAVFQVSFTSCGLECVHNVRYYEFDKTFGCRNCDPTKVIPAILQYDSKDNYLSSGGHPFYKFGYIANYSWAPPSLGSPLSNSNSNSNSNPNIGVTKPSPVFDQEKYAAATDDLLNNTVPLSSRLVSTYRNGLAESTDDFSDIPALQYIEEPDYGKKGGVENYSEWWKEYKDPYTTDPYGNSTKLKTSSYSKPAFPEYPTNNGNQLVDNTPAESSLGVENPIGDDNPQSYWDHCKDKANMFRDDSAFYDDSAFNDESAFNEAQSSACGSCEGEDGDGSSYGIPAFDTTFIDNSDNDELPMVTQAEIDGLEEMFGNRSNVTSEDDFKLPRKPLRKLAHETRYNTDENSAELQRIIQECAKQRHEEFLRMQELHKILSDVSDYVPVDKSLIPVLTPREDNL